jgi:choline-sulfatase
MAALLASLAGIVATTPARPRPQADPPQAARMWHGHPGRVPSSDIFLITIDTLRADHVGCYGDRTIRTPGLDRLAEDGVRFSNAFTPSPITNASHASILTGLVPSHHGVRDFGIPISPGVTTLAEVLKAHGYTTAAFIGSVILDSHGLAPGFDRGFDYYDNFPPNLPRTASRYQRLERRGMDVEHRAESWMLAHAGAQPKFVWVHFYDPHDPYDPPEPYRTEYAGRLYDGEIAYADSALGRFLDFLSQQRIYQDAAIVVVGDHGEGLGEHGEQTHGIFLYDSTTHVPLIVKPSLAAGDPAAAVLRGQVVNDQVRTTDIFPTVLDLAGIGFEKPLDGSSLRPLWTRAGNQPDATAASGSAAKMTAQTVGQTGPRLAYGETDYPLGFGWAPLRSVRLPGEKYIEAPRPEFYDLSADPAETKNVYEPWNGDVQKLRAMVAAMRKAAAPAGTAGAVGAAKIAELKALGYLGNNPGSTTAPEPSLLPDPKDKIQLFNLIHSSMLAAEDGRPEVATRDLEDALRLDPASGVVLSQLGELELDQGEYARAIDLLGRALQVRPQDSAAALDEARARFATGDLRGARDVLQSSENILTGNYDARVLLGKVDAGLKDWDKSEDALQAAIILDASKPEAYLELARVYLAEHKPEEALHQLDQVKRLAPESKEVAALVDQARRVETGSRR